MKKVLGFALMFVLAVAVFAKPAFAKTTQTVHVAMDVYVGDVKVPQGDYKVSWDGTGPAVEITMMLDGRKVVAAQARVVEGKHDMNNITISHREGKDMLQTIELKSLTLVVGQPVH